MAKQARDEQSDLRVVGRFSTLVKLIDDVRVQSIGFVRQSITQGLHLFTFSG